MPAILNSEIPQSLSLLTLTSSSFGGMVHSPGPVPPLPLSLQHPTPALDINMAPASSPDYGHPCALQW